MSSPEKDCEDEWSEETRSWLMAWVEVIMENKANIERLQYILDPSHERDLSFKPEQLFRPRNICKTK